MSKSKRNVLAIGAVLLLIGLWFGFLAMTGNLKSRPPSAPAMPEVSTKNAIVQKALAQKTNKAELNDLEYQLKKSGIKIHLSFTIGDEIEGKDFLLALLEDEESQKIFRQFSEAGITIIVGNRYDIFDGFVKINVKDGVKKAAEWLEKGQVK